AGRGPLRPFGGGPPERQRGISFAAGKLEIVWRGIVALEKNPQPPGAIENGNRHARRTPRQSRFPQRQSPFDRNILLPKDLPGTWSGQQRDCSGCGDHSERHGHPPWVTTMRL